MLEELIRAFFLIFAAEMGDKTQIMAMAFATQYKKMEVLIGVFLGVILNHGMAIIIGRYLSKVIPLNLLQTIAGVMFVIFGLLALTDEDAGEEESRRHFSPVLTVAVAFFLGELGDKTQLAALTLSTEGHYPLLILIGTTLGMVMVSGLGILVGSRVGKKIPETFIKIASSIIFLFFGTYKLMATVPARYITSLNISIYFVFIGVIEVYLLKRLLSHHKKGKKLALKEVADTLHMQTRELKFKVDKICLGEEVCGNCKESQCLIGYIKNILRKALDEKNYYNEDFKTYTSLINKGYDQDKLFQALTLIIDGYEDYGINLNKDFVINKTRKALEVALFGEEVQFTGNIDKYTNDIKKRIQGIKVLNKEIKGEFYGL